MAPTKPIVVGTFVLGALGLGIVAILVFGGMRFFTETTRVMVVFPDSVAGLSVGSPVTFRGVQVGRVKDIEVKIDVRQQTNSIPVYLDLEPARITFIDYSVRDVHAELAEAVRKGLRAQLISQSYVTGELSVNFDFHRDLAVVQPVRTGGVIEIPTIPSDLEDLKDQFRRLDLPALGQQTRQTLVSLQKTLDQVSAAVGPLTAQMSITLTATTHAIGQIESNATRTLQSIDRLAIDGRGQLKSKGDELDTLLQTAQKTTREAETLLGTLNDMTDPHSELRGDLQASVRDLAATSSHLREFTQDLNRRPIRTLMRNQ
jgi:paraquat-inducible protein B